MFGMVLLAFLSFLLSQRALVSLPMPLQIHPPSIAGGGDTLAAISTFKIADKIGYISTGGGAFLEYLEGKSLPAVAILEQRAAE